MQLSFREDNKKKYYGFGDHGCRNTIWPPEEYLEAIQEGRKGTLGRESPSAKALRQEGPSASEKLEQDQCTWEGAAWADKDGEVGRGYRPH